jgi:hypothetical protein
VSPRGRGVSLLEAHDVRGRSTACAHGVDRWPPRGASAPVFAPVEAIVVGVGNALHACPTVGGRAAAGRWPPESARGRRSGGATGREPRDARACDMRRLGTNGLWRLRTLVLPRAPHPLASSAIVLAYPRNERPRDPRPSSVSRLGRLRVRSRRREHASRCDRGRRMSPPRSPPALGRAVTAPIRVEGDHERHRR